MSDEPAAVIRIGDVTFEVWSRDHVRTILPGGGMVPASPDGSEGQAATARALGYGDDVARMVVEHELAHSALASWLGLPCSAVMRDVADGSHGDHAEEEALVLAWQRFSRSGKVDPALIPHVDRLEAWSAAWRELVAALP